MGRTAFATDPVIAKDGTIYLLNSTWDPSNAWALEAFNPDSTQKWVFPSGNISIPPAIAADGTIYLVTEEWGICAFNPDGSMKTNFPTPNGYQGQIFIGPDGTLYFGGNGIFALKPDGTEKWRFPLYFAGLAIHSDGTLYILTTSYSH